MVSTSSVSVFTKSCLKVIVTNLYVIEQATQYKEEFFRRRGSINTLQIVVIICAGERGVKNATTSPSWLCYFYNMIAMEYHQTSVWIIMCEYA